MKKFRTWHDQIEEIEVIRETEKFVVVPSGLKGERRDAKRSEYTNYFDTWQEAKDFLIDREKTAIIKLVDEVKRHQETLQKIEELT